MPDGQPNNKNEGFILIHRKIKYDWKWKNPKYRSAWVWMLVEAAGKDGYKGLKRGQLFFSTTWAPEHWGISKSSAARFLHACVKDKSIEWSKGNDNKDGRGTRPSIITIINYNKYQTLNGNRSISNNESNGTKPLATHPYFANILGKLLNGNLDWEHEMGIHSILSHLIESLCELDFTLSSTSCGLAVLYHDGDKPAQIQDVIDTLVNIKKTIERLHYLRNCDYQEYLNTPEWQAMREFINDRYNKRCALCGSKSDLMVHHKSYERKGYEDPDDLILICGDCHRKFHDIEP
jgi:5-methylcytosine-specific restriction endonuclease McrA